MVKLKDQVQTLAKAFKFLTPCVFVIPVEITTILQVMPY